MVREAIASDVKSIIYLGKQLDDNYENTNNLSNILNSKYDRIFVYDNIEICGFLHIIELVDSVDVINIVVDQRYQRRGIASLLMDYMFSHVSSDIKLFTLEVAVDNDKAINLYEKFGFKIINTRNKYYQGKDAYLMGRNG